MRTDEEQRKLVSLLRMLRLESHLTQINLADRLGLPQSYVSKYESGQRRLDILELRHLCRALGIDFIDFTRRLDKTLR